jgi:hypothetical protein
MPRLRRFTPRRDIRTAKTNFFVAVQHIFPIDQAKPLRLELGTGQIGRQK